MRRSLVVALLCLVSVSCSTQAVKTPSAQDSSASFPVTVTAANGAVTISARPQRIVSLSPTSTEMLFAVDAGKQVVAVDDQSNYPPQAPKTKLSGYQPNVEAIAGYQPDLVVFTGDVKGFESSLAKLQIVALRLPAAKDLDEAYAQIEQLGKATGHPATAAALIDRMRKDVARIVAAAPKLDSAPTFYHELDNTYYSVTSNTFIGKVYSLLGLRNIADPADKQATGYPQLSAEYIIQADPDLIFLADTKCCQQSAATLAKRAGWSDIAAVEGGHVVELDDDVASRWGPRIVDLLRVVADSLEKLENAA